MIYIKHRVNARLQLTDVDPTWGCEIDLRSEVDRPGQIHLAHDPWQKGENFEDWLAEYAKLKISGPLILNTKEDGLESRALELLGKFGIKNYFFLDTAFPTLIKWTRKNQNSNFAVRISAFESVGEALQHQSRVQWAWVDCFDVKPMEVEELKPLIGKFKICLVSPEMQGGPVEQIQVFKTQLFNIADAICTKRPDLW